MISSHLFFPCHLKCPFADLLVFISNPFSFLIFSLMSPFLSSKPFESFPKPLYDFLKQDEKTAWDTCKKSRWPQAGRKSEQNSRTPPKAPMLCDEGRLRIRFCSEPRSSYLAPGTSNELLLLSEPWIPVPLKPVPPLSCHLTPNLLAQV